MKTLYQNLTVVRIRIKVFLAGQEKIFYNFKAPLDVVDIKEADP
jgi:hypothetical protein